MSALYPLVYRDLWTEETITAAVTEFAISHGFDRLRKSDELHETDAERIIADIFRDHRITDESARARLLSQKPLLAEEYFRWGFCWSGMHGEITLVIAASNTIPFPSPDVQTSGELCFGCGFIDLDIPDRVIVDLGIDVEVHRLPTLFK